MSLGTAFYVLMLLWLVIGVFWSSYPFSQATIRPLGGSLLLFILLLLLGWKVFGSPIHP